jgi:hypothetical protein
MNYLLYLSYGRGLHEQEVTFSVLSASRWSDPTRYRVLIYTDHPESFQNLDADIVFVSPEQWDEWSGPRNFAHRRKILALQHALREYQSRVVLLDGDTWLRAPVDRLFDLVAPGRAVMHIREGEISQIDSPILRELTHMLAGSLFADLGGNELKISSDVSMWNAGVIGMDPAELPLLQEVLHLTDQFCAVSDLHVLEQFAFSWILQNKTELSECPDLVFHYWPPYLHQPFREQLPGLLERSSRMSSAKRIQYLYRGRPRPGVFRRGKVVLKRILQFVGLIRGRCRSNEW